MENVRLNMTNAEQLAFKMSDGKDYKSFNMNENSIDSLIQKEKSIKFNEQLDKFQETMEKNNNEVKDAQEQLSYDANKAEIKPMFCRVIVKPFKQNPFQKMEVSNGIITSTGGYTPHTELNPITGKYEEQKQFIVTGYVVEVGPEVRYLQEGDVIYYRVDTAVPVPFFKQNLISLDEKQIIAVVNENLSQRFNNLKDNGK